MEIRDGNVEQINLVYFGWMVCFGVLVVLSEFNVIISFFIFLYCLIFDICDKYVLQKVKYFGS